MSLDITLTETLPTEVYTANITHNLYAMADEAGIAKHLWAPEEVGITQAVQLIAPLHKAVAELKADPARFEKHNAPNGWGIYENFLFFVEQYLAACLANPNAQVRASR